MSDILVNTYNLKQLAGRLDNVNSRINRLDRRLNSLYTQVGLLGLYRLMQAGVLTGYSWRLLRCSSYLNQTASDFENAEKEIGRQDPLYYNPHTVKSAWFDYFGFKDNIWDPRLQWVQKGFRYGLGLLPGFGVARTALDLMTPNAWEAFWSGDLTYTDRRQVRRLFGTEDSDSYLDYRTYEESGSIEPDYIEYKNKDAIYKKKQNEIEKKKQISPDEKWYKQNGTLIEAGTEIKKEVSFLDGKLSGENDWAEGSLEGKFLTAEAYGSAAVGLYVYEKDKDGNVKRILSPGVTAEVGASAAVLQVNAEGRVGLGDDKNMLGVYGNAEAKVLTAEAKGKLAVNRKEVYAGLSAEADLVKASGTAGVSVLGTDIGVTGSVKVGIGAHAEVGYTDGKFKVDIGAAVGVGVDIGFEVDVGGTVDAIVGVATSVWEGVTGFFGGLFG